MHTWEKGREGKTTLPKFVSKHLLSKNIIKVIKNPKTYP
jgi:hypothetical protein